VWPVFATARITWTWDLGQGVFEVNATNGDTHLSGDDFDQRVIDWIGDEFKKDQRVGTASAQRCSPARGMTPGRSSTTWGIGTSSTRAATPSWRPIGSRSSGWIRTAVTRIRLVVRGHV